MFMQGRLRVVETGFNARQKNASHTMAMTINGLRIAMLG